MKIDLRNLGLSPDSIKKLRPEAVLQFNKLWDGKLQYAGWVDYPNLVTDGDLEVIRKLADNIRENSDVLIILGTGGSYMGAKAVTDLIPGEGDTELIFLGYDLSERHLTEGLSQLEGKNYSVLAISKSGTTMEPMASFIIMAEQLFQRYGAKEGAERIYVITEDKPSALHTYAETIGSHIVHMPMDIGGRYSVFTAVGLLPMAVHGIDIYEFISGARTIASKTAFNEDAFDYAISRFLLRGKAIEVFEVFDPYAEYMGHWLEQLFGESEGKDGKGIFPSVLLFNRDLHSMGQFLQEGSPVFFETMLLFGADGREQNQSQDREHKSCAPTTIPQNTILPYLSGRTFSEIRISVARGVIRAHQSVGIPMTIIEIPDITARSIGQFMYFFMIECAVSALLIGVNPFNQPGVEAYKRETNRMLLESE